MTARQGWRDLGDFQEAIRRTQALVDRLRGGSATFDEMTGMLRSPAALVRAAAMDALVDHARDEPGTVGHLARAVTDPMNRIRLMGTVSAAHYAFGCLVRLGSDASLETARELVKSWPEPDRTDLLWYAGQLGFKA